MLSFLRDKHHLWECVLLCGAGVAGLRLLFLALSRVFYEFQGGFEGDGHIYMAVGRGILNGLLPYRDLFETKPPGMFVISAASLGLFDSIALGTALQALITLGLACCTVLGAWIILRPRLSSDSGRLVLVLSVAVAALLAFYASVRSGGFQTESFGAFFIALYILTILLGKKRTGWLLPACAGVAVMIASGLKEPFLLAALGAALLFLSGWREWWRLFFVPLIIAGAGGVLLLFLCGWWDAYISVYLSSMFGQHLAIFGPTWFRAFFLDRLWTDLTSFALPLGVLAAALFLSSWWLSIDAGRSKRPMIAFGLSVLAAVITFLVGRSVAIHLLTTGTASGSVFMAVVCIFATGLGILAAVNIGFLGKQDGLSATAGAVRHLAFLYLLIQTIGMGGEFVGHHFGFGVPFFMALILHFFFCLASRHQEGDTRMLFPVAAGLVLVTLFLPGREDAARLESFLASERSLQAAARSFDAVLDSCQYDRYLIVGEVPVDIWAYSHHSPLGPAFFQYALNYPLDWKKPDPFFINSHLENLQKTPVVIVPETGGRPVPDQIVTYVSDTFTPVPPACAGSGVSLPGAVMLFRKGN